MCQHAEAESNYLQGVEDRAQIAGFAAARKRVAREGNPYANIGLDRVRFEAWDSGWSCWQSKVFPWSLEKKYRSTVGIGEAIKVRNEFQNDKTFPEDLEEMLDRSYQSQQSMFGQYKIFSF